MTQLFTVPGCRLVRVTQVSPTAITHVAGAKHDHACCPICRAVSTSFHTRYRRRPANLPASGKAVWLQLDVRRFHCRDPACPATLRRAVPEAARPPSPAHPLLADAQVRTGLALGAQLAAWLLAYLAMPSSATTLLRTIRDLPLSKAPRPRVVGVDDWALRKEQTHSIIVVDLERHRLNDLGGG